MFLTSLNESHCILQNCNENDPPCPIILLERFGFEMKKGYKETQLQLLLSPAILLSCDKVTSRSHRDKHLGQGHLMLSGLQVRGNLAKNKYNLLLEDSVDMW